MYIPYQVKFFGIRLLKNHYAVLGSIAIYFGHLTVGKRTEPIQPYRHFIAYIYCVEMSTLGGEFRGSNLDLYTLEEELSLK